MQEPVHHAIKYIWLKSLILSIITEFLDSMTSVLLCKIKEHSVQKTKTWESAHYMYINYLNVLSKTTYFTPTLSPAQVQTPKDALTISATLKPAVWS